MPTILVTGGNGYIGSHTVISLFENGYDVVIAQCGRRIDELAVDCCAVCGSEVLDEQILPHERESCVTCGDVACADHDVRIWAAADDYRPAHDDGDAAQLFRAFLDRELPCALFLPLAAYEADACTHDGKQEEVEQRYE